ncbi:MAG: hypothetical protein OXH32_12135 [Acidobacteria bacterium]|nr:hypothetical protein [Acidobacteriota bacterium]
MGRCRFCNREAGLFRREHADCVRLNAEGVQRLTALVADSELPPSACAEEVRRVAGRHRISAEQRQAALAEGWRSSVTASLGAGGLGREEEERLRALLGEFGLSPREVDSDGLWKQVADRRKRAAEGRIKGLVSEAVAAARGVGPEGSSSDADARTASALAAVEDAMRQAAEGGELSNVERREAVVAGLEAEMERLVAGELVTADQERTLETVSLHFGLDDQEKEKLNRNGVHERFVQALVLYDLSEGVAGQRQHVDPSGDDLPFRLKESETLLWLFQRVEYRTTETELWGHSFKGTGWVGEEEMSVSDTGLLGVTTGHLYFYSPNHRFRIPHGRIVTLRPRADGIGLTQDRPEARPEYFLLDDADFAYELLRNVPALPAPLPSHTRDQVKEQEQREPPDSRPARSAAGTGFKRTRRKGPEDGEKIGGDGNDGCGEGCGKGCGMGCLVFVPIGVYVFAELVF